MSKFTTRPVPRVCCVHRALLAPPQYWRGFPGDESPDARLHGLLSAQGAQFGQGGGKIEVFHLAFQGRQRRAGKAARQSRLEVTPEAGGGHIVFPQQSFQASQQGIRFPLGGDARGGGDIRAQRPVQGETAADAGLADQVQPRPEQGGMPGRQGKTETEAAMAARKAPVQLEEGLEQFVAVGFGDADAAVADADQQAKTPPPLPLPAGLPGSLLRGR